MLFSLFDQREKDRVQLQKGFQSYVAPEVRVHVESVVLLRIVVHDLKIKVGGHAGVGGVDDGCGPLQYPAHCRLVEVVVDIAGGLVGAHGGRGLAAGLEPADCRIAHAELPGANDRRALRLVCEALDRKDGRLDGHRSQNRAGSVRERERPGLARLLALVAAQGRAPDANQPRQRRGNALSLLLGEARVQVIAAGSGVG